MKITAKKTLIIAILLVVNGSCDQETQNPEKWLSNCNVANPALDLPWLKAKIASATTDSPAHPSSEFGVFSYRYQDRTIFELTDNPRNEPRSGYIVNFTDCEGNSICSIISGILYQNNCGSDFASKLRDKKTIFIK